MNLFDVVIIGGGPAGLNAAVVLGRCRRRVILFDTGRQRNRHSHGIHNYLTRDCILPEDFIEKGQQEINKYGVLFKKIEIINVSKEANGLFLSKDVEGNIYCSKKLLITTGLTDSIPGLKGFEEFYGTSIFHCPYCDAWEVKDKIIGVYAKNKNGFELALSLMRWSNTILYFTDGKRRLNDRQLEVLTQNDITVITGTIEKLEGANGKLKAVVMKNKRQHSCDALFFVNGYSQQSNLVEQLGCKVNKKKMVITNRFQQTNIEGVFVAGDADKDVHFVVVAAAEGAKAGVTINKQLQKEERLKRLPVTYSPLNDERQS